MSIFSRLLGDSNKREISNYQPLIDEVTGFESELEQLSDQQLRAKSDLLKEEIQPLVQTIFNDNPISGLDTREVNKNLKRIINEALEPKKAYAFALVREAAKRTIGLRLYDVQIVGGAVLHRGEIAEMQTGEGKTLVATLPLYLNGLTGLGTHLVTVNDYLARRDAGWMAPVFDLLGLSVGVIGPEFSYRYDKTITNEETDPRLAHFHPVSRREAYAADITYGTNNEFGFDYLRDNMAQSPEQIVQRQLAYAIVDEVDSILIDEARTPLIISAPSAESADLYNKFATITPKLKLGQDYEIDEKAKTASLNDAGIAKLESELGLTNLYEPAHVRLVHHADVALRAQALFVKNRDYVVKNGEIIIIDEFTGRMLQGRRYSAGLHQALEAKEKVAVREESVTLATITFQNLFRIYIKLAGMTGTAATEAEELAKIYNLEVVAIPTNRQSVRTDRQDTIYKTEEAKFRAVVELVKERQSEGQPVLIGTVSITKSERLAKFLKAAKVEHTVLNAKLHQKEGEVIAQAGRIGAVTVATNMAGRGVDIILGGQAPNEKASIAQVKKWEADHEKIIELGGLFVVGTERHESRRIDNQLRGRSGRQGDPGITQFFLSMEDDLMRIFGGDRMKSVMERLRLPDDVAINNRLLTRAIEQAQVKVETHNFEIRKQLVEYDDVMNKHREAIYARRQRILATNTPEAAQLLHQEIEQAMTEEQRSSYEKKYKDWASELRLDIERVISLRAIDLLWVEHLQTMEDLRESIGLRGYGQREPIVEYKQEAFRFFELLGQAIDNQISQMLLHVELQPNTQVELPKEQPKNLVMSGTKDDQPAPAKNASGKIGRNDPCPCGAVDPKSGKPYKYKKCGLINAQYHKG